MEIKQLKTVLAIAEHLSFLEAGLETSFSTSAVSKQLSSLEKELGVCLFSRKARSSVRLTPEGEALLPYFRRIVDEYDALLRESTSMNQPDRLVIASPKIFPQNIETELLGEFIQEYPEIPLNVVHGFIGEIIDMLYGGKIDLGVESVLGNLEDNPALLRLAGDTNLLSVPLMVRDDYILLHPAHPLAARSFVGIEDLAACPGLNFLFVDCYPDGPSIRKTIFLRECDKLAFTPKIMDFNYDRGVSALMARYISRHPDAAAIMPDLETDYPGTLRVRFDCAAFSPTTMVFCLRSNRSKALKAFLATANKVARRYLNSGV